MDNGSFVDFYEIMQLSPNAEPETIQRVFRILAQRYHPDNKDSGDDQTFQTLLKAYRVLSDPVERAAYDAQHRSQKRLTWKIFDQPAATVGRESERRKREGILGLLYRKRALQPEQPGMSLREMEDILGCPKEHLEFGIWYLRESGCIKNADNGRYTITVQGVDQYEETDRPESKLPMLPAPGDPSP